MPHKLPTVRWRKQKGREFGNFRIIYRGRRTEEPTRFRTKAEAEPTRRAREASLRAMYWREESGDAVSLALHQPTLGELAEAYCASLEERGKAPNTVATTPSRLWSIVRALGPDRLAHTVDNAVMDAWLAKRRKSRRLVRGKGGKMRPGTALISPTTIHNEESALQAMFRWAIRLKKIPDPDDPRRPLRALPWELAPEDRPRPETHRRRRIPDDHVRAIAEGLDPVSSEADLFILLALLTGARGEDLEALRWEHWTGTAWDLAGTSKTRQGVLWPVPKAFRPAVGRLASEGHVFDPPPSYRRIRNRTRALCGEAYSVKAFRHTLSSGFMAAGVHPRLTKAIMSHAFPRDVTQGYQWPTEQELLKAISAPWWVPILCRRAKNWGRIGGKRRKIQAA